MRLWTVDRSKAITIPYCNQFSCEHADPTAFRGQTTRRRGSYKIKDPLTMQPTTIRTVPVVSACGRARFTALTSQLIRLEWSMDGGFEDRPSIHFVQRDAGLRLSPGDFYPWFRHGPVSGDPGHVKIRYEESTLVMETEHLTLRYGNLPIETWDGQLSVTVCWDGVP
jgi:hypothetical protein